MEDVRKVGRPKKADYRKKRFRFSAIEDTLQNLINESTNEIDRKATEAILSHLKQKLV